MITHEKSKRWKWNQPGRDVRVDLNMSDQPCRFTAGFGAVCLAALAYIACGERSTDGLTATVTDQVHPVLIRNDHNVVLQVEVDSKRRSPAHLQSIEFALDGTDDPNDLESLELFHTGAKREFAADARFGERAQPSAKISF